MLVPFTPNGTEISKLLDGDALLSTQSPLLDTYNADDEAQLEKALGIAKNPNIAESCRETEMDRLQVRVEQTLQSLDGVAAWLGRLPGRKNLYWLSAGFPLSAEPRLCGTELTIVPARDGCRATPCFSTKLIPVWRPPESLSFRSIFAAIRAPSKELIALMYRVLFMPKPAAGVRYSDDVNQAVQRLNSEHAEMEEIAEQTGGIAHYNRNDLDRQLSDQFSQAQNYYTLSYSPTDKNWNGKYRKINLKLKDSSYHVYYRRGYFADTPPPTPFNAADAFTLAMRYGAAPSTSILFNARLERTLPVKSASTTRSTRTRLSSSTLPTTANPPRSTAP